MGDKPLTWQQTVAVLVFLAVLTFCIFGFAPNIDPSLRQVGYLGLPLSVGLFVALLVWHVKANNRPDVHPDVLAAIVSPAVILQLGRGHLTVRLAQIGSSLWIEILAQNLYDGVASLRLHFSPDRLLQPFPLHCQIPGAGVIRAGTVLALESFPRAQVLKIEIAGSFTATGQQIRFARRAAITKKANPALTGALLLAGHLHFGGGTFLKIKIVPVDPGSESPAPSGEWEIVDLWQSGEKMDLQEIAARMQPVELATQGQSVEPEAEA